MSEKREFVPRLGNVIKTGVVLAAGFYLASNAFSKAVRRQIWERASGVCERTGRNDWPRECSHYNHDKDYPGYNNADNGQLLLRLEHYIEHVNTHGYNGLSEDGNQWALEQIWDRMTEAERNEVISRGYVPPIGAYQLNLI